jgi:hypothetical protein
LEKLLKFLIFCNLWRFRVGIDVPTIEVRYDNLNIEAEAYVGSSALPSFAKFTFNIIEVTTLANI